MDIYPQKYYVYFYLRQDYTPYYIGKGCGKRAWNKNKSEKIQPPKDKNRIILVEQNLTELQAFILERYYINWFGRAHIETGILLNKSEGGYGKGSGVSSEIAIKTQRKKVEEGIHHWLKREDGTSHGKRINEISVQNGSNPLLMREDGTSIGKEINEIRVKNGTHHFFKHKGSITCRNKQGILKRIPLKEYHSQTGNMENWEWAAITSKEGKKRKLIMN